MYGEDVDLCFRAKKCGFSVVYFLKASVPHIKGKSDLNAKNKTVLYRYKAMIVFYNKHYKRQYNFLLTWLVHIAIWSKYSLDLLKLKVKR